MDDQAIKLLARNVVDRALAQDIEPSHEDLPRIAPLIAAECGPDLDLQRRVRERLERILPRSNNDDPPLPITANSKSPAQLKRLFGRFEILKQVGRGGMGVVYKAHDTRLGRIVALKIIRSGHYASESERLRFDSEARAIARLDHPNIVRVFEVGEHDGQPWISFEYVDGGTLATRLNRSPQSPKVAAAFVEKLARAVWSAHVQEVIHRDLKPSNILLVLQSVATPDAPTVRDITTEADGHTSATTLQTEPNTLTEIDIPKIADFGLAKLMDVEGPGISQTDAILGTPSYMAPEQAAGKNREVGRAVDIYALGAILYETLTGRPPFLGTTARETLAQVCNGEPVPPRRLQPKIPRDLETVCMECLQKDPGKRYASAKDLADDLRSFLEGRPIEARPVGRLERAAKWIRRNPTLTGALVVLAAALVASLGWGINARYSAQLQTQKNLAEKYRTLLTLNTGLAFCEKGDPAKGMLQMAWALENCPKPESELDLRIRRALSSAAVLLHPMEEAYRLEGRTSVVASSLDGNTLFFGGYDEGRLFHFHTNESFGLPVSAPGEEFSSAAFSPDGRLCAAATQQGVIRIVDAATGKINHTINLQKTVKSVGFHPSDGRTLVVAALSVPKPLQETDPATLLVLDSDTGERKSPAFTCTTPLYMAAYSPDGTRIATAANKNHVQIWDAETGKPIGQPLPHPGPVFCLGFSPDGTTIATGCRDGGVRFWNVAAELDRELAPTQVLYEKGPVRSTVFTPDGKIVLCSTENGKAQMWDVETGQPVGPSLSHGAELRLAIFRNRPERQAVTQILTTGFEGTARVWRIGGNDPSIRMLPQKGSVSVASFSKDGSLAIVGSEGSEKGKGESQLLRMGPGELKPIVLPQDGQVLAGVISDDGQLALTGGNDNTARLWNTADGSIAGGPWAYGNIVGAAAFNPGGTMIAFGGRGGMVELRAGPNWDLLTRWRAYEDSYWVWNMTFTSDGTRLFTSGGKSGKVWSVPDGKLLAELPHSMEVRQGALSTGSGGQIALTGSQDHTAFLWLGDNWSTKSRALEHQGDIRAVAFRADGNVAATAGADGTARLWKVPSGESLTPALLHPDWVRSVAFSRDQSTLVTACDDGIARQWSVEDGSQTGAFLQHRGAVTRIAISPRDGNTILTGSADGVARLWVPPEPMQGSPVEVTLRVQVLTGMMLNKSEGTVQFLTYQEWKDCRERLRSMSE